MALDHYFSSECL